MAWLVLAALIVSGALLLLRGSGGLLDSLDGGDMAVLVTGVILVSLFTLRLIAEDAQRPGRMLRNAAIWIALLLGLVGVYGYREELTAVAYRVAGELLPAGQAVVTEGRVPGERAVRLRSRTDGHFVARAELNGASVTLLVDTGASTVVLRPVDAERAGISTRDLDYTVPVQTANGLAYAAPARVRSIAIGPIIVEDVEALIAKPGSIKEGLLGMSFLKRLRSYEFSGDFLTLRG